MSQIVIVSAIFILINVIAGLYCLFFPKHFKNKLENTSTFELRSYGFFLIVTGMTIFAWMFLHGAVSSLLQILTEMQTQ